MDEFIPIERIRRLLLGRGHEVVEADGSPGSLAIAPPEDVYLTIALEPDAVLYRRWRRRYFLCKPDARAILESASMPGDFQRRWEAMIEGAMGGLPGEVLAGLATWTATRLSRCKRVYVWKPERLRLYEDYVGTACDEVAGLLGSSIGPGRLRRHIEAGPSAHASVLGMDDPEFPQVIAAYFLFASQNCLEICFAGDDGSEVFMMHHHDKVIVSVPDATTRSALVEELSSNPVLFADASDYELMQEPEDMTEEEWMEGT